MIENDAPKSSLEMFGTSVGGIRSFIEEFGIHLLLETSIVALIDGFLVNTALSMLLGISIVEGCQWLWRKWKK